MLSKSKKRAYIVTPKAMATTTPDKVPSSKQLVTRIVR